MKAIFITIFMAVLSVSCFSQKKAVSDTARKDTTTKASVFVLAMPQQNWEALIKLIQSADEKPSIIKEWVTLIATNVREVAEPKKK